jgi:hypothetical protein
MTRLTVAVYRKTRDLVRDAAEDTLLRASGGGDGSGSPGGAATVPPVRGIDRAELWTFDMEDATADAGVRRALEDTTLVVNPNLHRWSLDTAEAVRPATGARLTLIVRDRVDAKGRSVLRAMRDRLGVKGLTGVTRAVRWAIDVEGDAAAAEALAARVTGADGRGAGLLANPHSQDVDVRVESA